MKIERERWFIVYKNPYKIWVIADSSIHSKRKYSIEAFSGIYPRNFLSIGEYEKSVAQIWKESRKNAKARCVKITLSCEIPDEE